MAPYPYGPAGDWDNDPGDGPEEAAHFWEGEDYSDEEVG